MLTKDDIDKRIRMSKADCIITDIPTAMKVNQGVGGATLRKKILVEDHEITDGMQEEINKLKLKGKYY